MSNPTFRTGPFSFAVKSKVDKFHVVALDAAGIAPAAAAGPVFGAVSESGAPQPTRESGDLSHGLPDCVAVHTAGALPLTVATGSGAIAAGAPVYAAADGTVSATGTVFVGTALGATNTTTKLVRVLLAGPSAPTAAGGEG